ncbi:MAG: hypothetical protein V5A27_08685 [Halapricum sp.]
MSGPEFDASGPLDVSTLEGLAGRATTHPLVTDATFEPDSISPRVLAIHLDSEQYPDPISEVRLDIRWLEGGDYSMHYVEVDPEGMWQCRWDRHPKPDAPYEHVHPPPDARSAVEPSPINGDNHLAVLFAVLGWIEERLREHYDT